MARRTNSIAFKNGQVFEEDGVLFITEVKKDYVETHNLTDWILSFAGDDRFADITIREVFDVEGKDL